MSTDELRKRLINRIRRTTDAKLLLELDRTWRSTKEELKIFRTTASQRAAITKSKADLRNGKVRSAELADKAIEEWLNK